MLPDGARARARAAARAAGPTGGRRATADGDLFPRVVAFSPGFVPAVSREGRPAVFVSHGDADEVLPVERTSRRIVPALRDEGYDVTYREFAGGHAVPHEVAVAAVDWLGAG